MPVLVERDHRDRDQHELDWDDKERQQPEELLGLLTLLVVPVQLVLIAIAMVAFNQNWHVEEERPIGGGDYDDTPPDQRPAAAPA